MDIMDFFEEKNATYRKSFKDFSMKNNFAPKIYILCQ